MTKRKGIYEAILERIFVSKYEAGMSRVDFRREDIVSFAKELGVDPPKNLGDLVYSFRYRAELPEEIRKHAGDGFAWIIRGSGAARYSFIRVPDVPLVPNANLAETKIPDATPGVVAKYALSDEQALLAIVRYNRLVDVFLEWLVTRYRIICGRQSQRSARLKPMSCMLGWTKKAFTM